MKRITCPRCNAQNAMHEDTAVLENGRLDHAWSCDFCGHVSYGEVEHRRSLNEQRRRAEGRPEPYRLDKEIA